MSTMFEQFLNESLRNKKLNKYFDLLEDMFDSDDMYKNALAMKMTNSMEARYITHQKNQSNKQSSIYIQELNVEDISSRIKKSHTLLIEEDNDR